MSIIQEALRRKDGDPPSLSSNSDQGSPPPDLPSKKEKPPRKPGSFGRLLLVLLVVLVLIVGVGVMLMYGVKGLFNEKPFTLADAQPAEDMPSSAVNVSPEPVVGVVSDVEKPAAPAEEMVVSDMPEPVTVDQESVPVVSAEPVDDTSEKEAVTEEFKSSFILKSDQSGKPKEKDAQVLMQMQAEEKKEPVRWPRVSLKGIMAQGGKKVALLNDDMVSQGGAILGVTVTRIRDGDIDLEYKGEQRSIRVGQSTR